MSDSTILFLSRPLQENVHFKFYQLVEPQATVLCSHHSLLEAAGRLIKDPIPVPSRPTLWFSHLPRPSSYKSVEEPDYFLTHPSVKTRPEKKTGGSQAFQDQQIQKFSQFFQLLLLAKHRHVTPAMWAPWKTLACCSITS